MVLLDIVPPSPYGLDRSPAAPGLDSRLWTPARVAGWSGALHPGVHRVGRASPPAGDGEPRPPWRSSQDSARLDGGAVGRFVGAWSRLAAQLPYTDRPHECPHDREVP